jgi:subtilisin
MGKQSIRKEDERAARGMTRMALRERSTDCPALFLAVVCFHLLLSACGPERDVIVGFHDEPGPSERALVQGNGGFVSRVFHLIPALAVRLPEEVLADLRQHPNVAYLEEDAPVTAVAPVPDGLELEDSWGVSHIGSNALHDQNIKGAGVRIAVLDTGIDYNHPDLDGNFAGGDNFISIDPDNHDPYDDSWNSHGTHVAGIIAAEQNGEGVVGVAPEASLYAVKVLDGAGFGSISSLIAGIEWAVANGMDVANMSIEVGMDFSSLEQACAAAEDAGLLIVAAAGNTYGDEIMYPARYDSVVAVTATGMDDSILSLSPAGPEMELAAPGEAIYSTTANGAYGLRTGTSQAAPHVTGVAALVLSSGFDQDLNGDGIVDPRDVRLQLRQTALDLGDPGLDPVYGYGLVSAAAADPLNPASHLVLTRLKGPPKASAKTATLSGRLFEITIVNVNLAKIDVRVCEDGVLLKELSTSYLFCPTKPPQVTFQMDATGTTFEVHFVPRGRLGGAADVYIEGI